MLQGYKESKIEFLAKLEQKRKTERGGTLRLLVLFSSCGLIIKVWNK